MENPESAATSQSTCHMTWKYDFKEKVQRRVFAPSPLDEAIRLFPCQLQEAPCARDLKVVPGERFEGAGVTLSDMLCVNAPGVVKAVSGCRLLKSRI